jgi:hypothetical protein
LEIPSTLSKRTTIEVFVCAMRSEVSAVPETAMLDKRRFMLCFIVAVTEGRCVIGVRTTPKYILHQMTLD